jgi:GNAT superfamily N-acetyltransferase
MSDIKIKKVVSKKDQKKFIKFPWEVYKDYPNWVPPLIMEMKEKLDKKHNPFFEHAEMELFLAFDGDELKGRVAAILDENHNKMHNEKVVFFGLYESFSDIDITRALLDRVMEWGKERGMNILRGPVNISMNDECAFLLEGFNSPPVAMMPYNPAYYLDLMEEYGLAKAKDLLAFLMIKDHDTQEKVSQIVSKIKKSVEKIKYVYNQAWEKNWGFVPWTEKEMEYMAKNLKKVADPDIIILAEDGDRPIGFAFSFPNLNEALIKLNGRMTPLGILKFLYYRKKIKGTRAVVFGILKEYRMSGVSYLLFSELEKNTLARGYEWCETSYQLEDNDAINRFVMSIGGKVYKKYRIYEKPVS